VSGLGQGFGLFRPRRPSYTYATQTELAYLGQYGRQRTESYRYADLRNIVFDNLFPDEWP
jgi:hypothetical protein